MPIYPLQTRTPDLWTNNEQPKRRNEMSDKPEYVWIFDINRRIYNRDENGRAYGGPVWREHWQKHEITGETIRSWIRDNVDLRSICFTDQELEDVIYIHDNERHIAERVRKITDVKLLKQVAELIGYTGEMK
jgi:hypothetical protein